MAKVGSLYLKGAKGKLAGATLYQANGETMIRDIVTPKNPKTGAQTAQRVIMNTVIKNYSAMKEIVNHSFEGRTMGQQNMARFVQLNSRKLRDLAARMPLANVYNFIPVGSTTFIPCESWVAEGTLPNVNAAVDATAKKGTVGLAANTYQGVIDNYNLQRGDQLTFLTVEKVNGEYKFFYARVILDPHDAKGDVAALSSAFISNGVIGTPSDRNEGSFSSLAFADNAISFAIGGGSVVAAAVIVSRKVGSYWFRSNAKLAVSVTALGSDAMSLADALAQSQQVSASIDTGSNVYLNNAGQYGNAETGDTGGGTGGGPSTEG